MIMFAALAIAGPALHFVDGRRRRPRRLAHRRLAQGQPRLPVCGAPGAGGGLTGRTRTSLTTRGDAKFDIDGGAVTLSHYAELGGKLGGSHLLGGGEPIQVGRTARMGGQHVWARRRGPQRELAQRNFEKTYG